MLNIIKSERRERVLISSPMTTYIQMDDTLISTVYYTRSITSCVHEKFLLEKKNA